MHSLTAHSANEKAMLPTFSDARETQTLDQQVPDQPLPWAKFLSRLENFCLSQGWSVEDDDVGDGSCTILMGERRNYGYSR